MRLSDVVVGAMGVLLAGAIVLAQQPGPTPPPSAPPCYEQLRITTTKYEIKRNQAELAEQNVAQLLEQLRQAQLQNADMKSEIDKLKDGAKSPGN